MMEEMVACMVGSLSVRVFGWTPIEDHARQIRWNHAVVESCTTDL
nr:MAG TPA: hypothetical protein [Caudoviricetes sp.]